MTTLVQTQNVPTPLPEMTTTNTQWPSTPASTTIIGMKFPAGGGGTAGATGTFGSS